jgi:hypothetical protein
MVSLLLFVESDLYEVWWKLGKHFSALDGTDMCYANI